MQHLQLERYLHASPERSSDPPRRNLGLTQKQTRTIATGTSFALLWLTVGPSAQAAVTRKSERGHTRKLNKVEMARIVGSLTATMQAGFATDTGDAQPWQGSAGDVSTLNGNKLTDLSLVGWKVKGGRLGIGFTLTHNSKTSVDTFVGRKWTHTYDIYLKPASSTGGGTEPGGGGPIGLSATPGDSSGSSSSSAVSVHWGDDTSYGFSQNIDGSYSAATGHYDTMTVSGSGASAVYTITTKDQTRYQFVSFNSGSIWYCNQIQDRNGNSVSISRNTSGGVTSVSDGNRSLSFAYNTNGKITSVSDPLNRTWTLSYNTAGDLTQVAFPQLTGDNTTYTVAYGYNTNHDITTLTDKRGKVWSYGYNASDSLTSETDPLNHGTSYSYTSGTSGQTTITDALGHTTRHNYTNGVLTSVQDAGNYTESYSYDSQYNKTGLTDKRGKVWSFTYDAKGNVLTKTDPLNHTVTNTYNAKNDVLTTTTHLGFVTSYSYDTSGNLTGVSDPLSHSTTYTVNSYGQTTAITDALNHTSYLGYDSNGNLTTVTDALGHLTTTGYNTLGWVISVTDGTNLTTSTSYDNWGRSGIVTAPGSRTVSTVYDANDNTTSVTDPLGKVTSFVYDDAGRLTSSTDPLNRTVYYGYDNANRKTSFIDGRGKITGYGYTNRNQLSAIAYADGTSDAFSYNANGALATKTDGRGVTITTSYDDAGRLAGKGYSDSTASVSFAYDNDNRKTSMTDGTGTTSYSYDAASRLTSRSAPGTGVLSISYGYDNANRMTSRTTAGSSISTFSYDDANRMTSTTSPGGTTGLTTSYTYDSANRQLSTTSPDGSVQTNTYDANTADLTGVVSQNSATNTVFDSHSYTYRADGRKTSESSMTIVSGTPTTSAVSYSYDDAGQLTGENHTGANAFTTSYSYDLAGNRASKTLNGVTESYSYDDAGKLLSAGNKTYTYDYAGNRTSVSDGSTTQYLTWDAEERLTFYGNSTLTNNYFYNGLGQRVEKHEGGGQYKYTMVDDSIDSAYVSDNYATYLYGTNRIGEVRNGVLNSYHSDALGTTRAEMYSFPDGVFYGSLGTDAFGMTVSRVGDFARIGFGGQHGYQSDYSTGLMRLGHRYYDASTGSFISRDPIQDGDNWYTYCNNDPVNGIDPEGLENNHGSLINYTDQVQWGVGNYEQGKEKEHVKPWKPGDPTVPGYRNPDFTIDKQLPGYRTPYEYILIPVKPGQTVGGGDLDMDGAWDSYNQIWEKSGGQDYGLPGIGHWTDYPLILPFPQPGSFIGAPYKPGGYLPNVPITRPPGDIIKNPGKK